MGRVYGFEALVLPGLSVMSKDSTRLFGSERPSALILARDHGCDALRRRNGMEGVDLEIKLAENPRLCANPRTDTCSVWS